MTRIEFITFLRTFSKDKSNWENKTLEGFLEAMANYTEDIPGYYSNTNSTVNADEPSWENFKNIIIGASIYE